MEENDMRSYSNNELNDLLSAPESEHYESKEAKNQFKFEDAAKYGCALYIAFSKEVQRNPSRHLVKLAK